MQQQTSLFGITGTVTPREHNGKFMPKVKDPQADIKKHLEAGLSISVLDGLRLYHTTETRRIISRLAKKGMKFIKTWHEVDGKKMYLIYKMS